MKIEHIAIWTNDLETMKSFYIKYFHATANNKYTNHLMRKPEYANREVGLSYLGYAHLAFSTGSKDKVIQLHPPNLSTESSFCFWGGDIRS